MNLVSGEETIPGRIVFISCARKLPLRDCCSSLFLGVMMGAPHAQATCANALAAPFVLGFEIMEGWSRQPLSSLSRSGAARRRRHEFGADRVGNGLAEDPIDVRLAGRIELPAAHLVDREQLGGVARAP